MIMMGGDRKKAITAILGPDDPGVGVTNPEEDDQATKHAIARDALDCMKNDDHEGFANALSSFHTYCSGGMSTEGE